jgi:hypothetical protein
MGSNRWLGVCVFLALSLGGPRPTRAAWPLGPDPNQAYKPGIADGDEYQPQVRPDAERGWCLAWNQLYYTAGIRVQRLDRFGVPQWGANGRLLTSWDPLLGDGPKVRDMRPFADGHMLVATANGDNRSLGLWCVDSLGQSCWGPLPVPVSDSASLAVHIWPVSPSDGWLLWWVFTSTGGFLRARRVGTGDPTTWGPVLTLTTERPRAGVHLLPGSDAIEDGDEAIYLPWAEGSSMIGPRLQKLTAGGSTPWGDSGVPVSSLSSTSLSFPSVAPDGAGGAFVAVTTDFSTHYDVRVQRIRANGQRAFGIDGLQVPAHGFQSLGIATSVPAAPGTANVIATDRAVNGGCFATIDTSGIWSPANGGTPLTNPANSTTDIYPALTTGDGGFVTIWSRWKGYETIVLEAQRIDAHGARCWSDSGVALMRFQYPAMVPVSYEIPRAALGARGDLVALRLVRDDTQSPPRPSKAYVNHVFENGAFVDPTADVAGHTPLSFSFSSLVPNPCRDHLQLQWSCPETGRTRIELFDVSGRAVDALFDGVVDAGAHAYDAHLATTLRTGMYFVRLTWRDWRIARRVVLTR